MTGIVVEVMKRSSEISTLNDQRS